MPIEEMKEVDVRVEWAVHLAILRVTKRSKGSWRPILYWGEDVSGFLILVWTKKRRRWLDLVRWDGPVLLYRRGLFTTGNAPLHEKKIWEGSMEIKNKLTYIFFLPALLGASLKYSVASFALFSFCS